MSSVQVRFRLGNLRKFSVFSICIVCDVSRMIVPPKIFGMVYSKILGSIYCLKAEAVKCVIENKGHNSSFSSLDIVFGNNEFHFSAVLSFFHSL